MSYDTDSGPSVFDRDWPTLNLSSSGVALGGRCWRAYFLKTYWTWQAWNRGSAQGVQSRVLAYALKNGLSVRPYAGTTVHWLAAWVLRRAVAGQSTPSIDELRDMAVKRFLEGLDAAAKRTPQQASKTRPMSVDVFYNGKYDPGELADAVDTIRQSIGELMLNDHVEIVRDLANQGGRILSIEEPVKYQLEVRPGVFGTVFVVTDLAYLEMRKDEVGPFEDVIIVDWKTGKRRDEHADQLDLYAAWAFQHERGEVQRRVRSMAIYLATGEWLERKPTVQDAKAAEKRLIKFARSLESRVVDGDLERNEPRLGAANADAWPQLPEGSRACQWCEYRRLCKRG